MPGKKVSRVVLLRSGKEPKAHYSSRDPRPKPWASLGQALGQKAEIERSNLLGIQEQINAKITQFALPLGRPTNTTFDPGEAYRLPNAVESKL